MSFRGNLRRARSHILIIVVLIVAGTIIVNIEDKNLSRETGREIPDHGPVMDRIDVGK